MNAVLRVEGDKVVICGNVSYSPGVMLVDADGLILYAGRRDEAPETPATIETLYAELIIPGFVDIHNHGDGKFHR